MQEKSYNNTSHISPITKIGRYKKVDAIILAGSPASPEFGEDSAVTGRAMIKLGSKTMLQWVVDALRESKSIGRIVAVGNVSADGLDEVIDPGDGMVSNIRIGFDALKPSGPVFVICSDIPLITPEGIDDFISKASALNVGLVYPIVKKERCQELYPQFSRTYLKTADGTFTGGNAMLVSPQFIENNWHIISDAYKARKKVLSLARMIGMGFLLRVIIAQIFPSVLTLAILEKTVSRMLKADVKAVISDYPEIGEDVDKLSDIEAVREILK